MPSSRADGHSAISLLPASTAAMAERVRRRLTRRLEALGYVVTTAPEGA
jgi:hypothetical protein